MKLIDLLVKELPKRGRFPDDANECVQDSDGTVKFFDSGSLSFGGYGWSGSARGKFYCKNEDKIMGLDLSCDYSSAIITRAQYEAALAVSKAVVGREGWIQWAGGDCPVDSDAIVEVKFRNPNQYQFNSDRAGDFSWEHDGIDGDIIAYRLQKQTKSEQVRADAWRSYAGITENDEEADLNECIGQDVDMPEWNGEGLPPVGTICQAKVPRSITGWEWRRVKVVESGIPGAEKEVLVYDLETTLPAWTDEFRPLRTEAEKAREKLAASLHIAAGASPIELNGIGRLYFKLADAIISGSVFGTTFKAGK